MYLGDVAPFVEPANRLVARGHDVTYVVPTGFHDLLGGEAFGLTPYPLDCSPRALHADPEHQRLMRHPVRRVIGLSRYWLRAAFLDATDRVRAELLDTLADADVVVSHPTMAMVTAPICRHLGTPLVVGHLFPMMIPTAEWAFPVDRWSPDLGATANLAAWRLFTAGAGALFNDRDINAFRRTLGQPPRRGNSAHAWDEADRTVVLVSPHYAGPPPADWPPSLTWGGFSHWPGPADQEVDPAVDAYLDAGDPPVLVTLGTSAATGAGAAFAAIAEGLDRLGLRSLLLVGTEENRAAVAHRPGAFTFAPVAHVLPRCRAAIVSGALGTLAAALGKGVPVVVLPQLFDQVWHGGQVARHGVGTLARSPAGAVRAVARLDADPSYAERARALAAALAGEDGATALADAVDETVPA
jgi:rhamnosyltransferase subunit B